MPNRLNLPKGISGSRTRNKVSVLALYHAIKDALSFPDTVNVSLINACESQRALSKLSVQEISIFPMSLNTLKRVADLVVEDGGWCKLNSLRIELRKLLGPKQSRKQLHKASKAKSSDKLIISNQKLEAAYRCRANLTRANIEALSILRFAAKSNPQVEAKLVEYLASYGNYIGLSIVDTHKKDES